MFSGNPDEAEIRVVVAKDDINFFTQMSFASSGQGYNMAEKRRDFFLDLKKFDFESSEDTGLGSRFVQFAKIDPETAKKIVAGRHQYWSKVTKQINKSAIGINEDNYLEFVGNKIKHLGVKLEKMG